MYYKLTRLFLVFALSLFAVTPQISAKPKPVIQKTDTIKPGIILRAEPSVFQDQQFLNLLSGAYFEVTQVFPEYAHGNFKNIFFLTASSAVNWDNLAQQLAGIPNVHYAVINTAQVLNDNPALVDGEISAAELKIIFKAMDATEPAFDAKTKILTIPLPTGTVSTLDLFGAMLNAVNRKAPGKIYMSFSLPQDFLMDLVLAGQPSGTHILDANGEQVIPPEQGATPDFRYPYSIYLTQSTVLDAEYVDVILNHSAYANIQNTDFVELRDSNGVPVSWILPSTRIVNTNMLRTGVFRFQVPGVGAVAGPYHFEYCPLAGTCYARSNDFTVVIGPPVVISNAVAVNITDRSACLRWRSNRPTMGQLWIGDPGLIGPQGWDNEPVLDHAHRWANGYYYGLWEWQGQSNAAFGPLLQFTTNGTPDTTPPVISGVSAVPTRDSVTISFTANELSDTYTRVIYRPSGTVIVTLTQFFSRLIAANTPHQVIQYNLPPNMPCEYWVRSTDVSNNRAESPSFTQPGRQFRTLP